MIGAAEFFRRFDDLLGEDPIAVDDSRTLGLDSLRLASSRGSNLSDSTAAREDLLPV